MTRLTRPLVSTIALSLAGVTTQAALADDATLDFGVPAWGAYLKKSFNGLPLGRSTAVQCGQ